MNTVTCPKCGGYVPGHATGAGDICTCEPITRATDAADAEIARLENIVKIQRKQIERLIDERLAVKISTLTYALNLVQGRRVLNRTPAYLACVDELETFLKASIERVKLGEEMHSTAVVQADGGKESHE
jgi:hypothetical protein